jgi:hypothetical protein
MGDGPLTLPARPSPTHLPLRPSPAVSSPPQPAPDDAVHRPPRRRGAVGPDKDAAPVLLPWTPPSFPLLLPRSLAASFLSLSRTPPSFPASIRGSSASPASPTSPPAPPPSPPSSPATHARRSPPHCPNRGRLPRLCLRRSPATSSSICASKLTPALRSPSVSLAAFSSFSSHGLVAVAAVFVAARTPRRRRANSCALAARRAQPSSGSCSARPRGPIPPIHALDRAP